MADENLGIRARRSKYHRARSQSGAQGMRNPLVDRTLDMDLPEILRYSELYSTIEEKKRKYLDMYVFGGKTLDYYHGSYVSVYQEFIFAYQSNNELAPTLMEHLCAIAAKIANILGKSAPTQEGHQP